MEWEGKPGTNQKDNTRYDLFPECHLNNGNVTILGYLIANKY